VGSAERWLALAAALLGLAAVVLAALGSHAVDMQGQAALRQIWHTASMMHMFHAAALLALAGLKGDRRWVGRGAWLLVAGTVIFCGSLYLRVLLPTASAPVAPFGGFLLMLGWLLIALGFLRE
jgi:uncharacterized membrane protein YgdD (TMEM256/DUF423 family)